MAKPIRIRSIREIIEGTLSPLADLSPMKIRETRTFPGLNRPIYIWGKSHENTDGIFAQQTG
jgi:hypothetical protein